MLFFTIYFSAVMKIIVEINKLERIKSTRFQEQFIDSQC